MLLLKRIAALAVVSTPSVAVSAFATYHRGCARGPSSLPRSRRLPVPEVHLLVQS